MGVRQESQETCQHLLLRAVGPTSPKKGLPPTLLQKLGSSGVGRQGPPHLRELEYLVFASGPVLGKLANLISERSSLIVHSFFYHHHPLFLQMTASCFYN